MFSLSLSFAFFALFVSRQALFILLFVCFHCSENHVHIHIHIQRFTYTEFVSTRCGCRILNLCVFEANPIFTDFLRGLAPPHRFRIFWAARFTTKILALSQMAIVVCTKINLITEFIHTCMAKECPQD